MAISQIVDIAECLAYLNLGSSATEQQLGMIQLLKTRAEAKVRRYLRRNVTQATYTHYLPGNVNPWDVADRLPFSGPTLWLTEAPVRSITSIYVDRGGKAGQASGAFPASSLLVAGTDYMLDIKSTGWCPSGRVILNAGEWPADPGSIKVTYVAGWTDNELIGNVTDPTLDASDLHLATLIAVSRFFSTSTRYANGGSGDAITRERIEEYEVEFAVPQQNSQSQEIDFSLPAECISLLDPFRRKVFA